MKVFRTNTNEEVIFKINLLLKKHGLWFESDKVTDEYAEYVLKVEESLCNCWAPHGHDFGCKFYG